MAAVGPGCQTGPEGHGVQPGGLDLLCGLELPCGLGLLCGLCGMALLLLLFGARLQLFGKVQDDDNPLGHQVFMNVFDH